MGSTPHLATGTWLIARERRRQAEQEGYSPEHDDTHDRGELIAAARCYAWAATPGFVTTDAASHPPQEWPWDAADWKPDWDDPTHNLVRAGALILRGDRPAGAEGGARAVKQIPLRARDGSVRAYALVDDEDGEWLTRWRWSLSAGSYAVRGGGVLMHRAIADRMGFAVEGALIHHDDDDSLNNRRSNLVKTTRVEHPSHHRKPGNRTRRTTAGRWYAWRNEGGQQVKVGTFDTEEEACAAPGAS